MHVILPYEPKVILTTWEGITRVYASRKVALECLGRTYLRFRIGPRVDVDLRWSTLFTELGEQLFASDFQNIEPRPRLGGFGRRYDSWDGAGPVPGTGRHHGGHYFRRPRTMPERRLNSFCDEDAGEPRARARRSPSSLPQSWDDLSISTHGHRTWKRHRKTQWKEKSEKV